LKTYQRKKILLLLIAFPDSTIGDLLGMLLLSVGLLQIKIEHSTLFMEDPPYTFQKIIKNLLIIKRELDFI